MISIIYFTCTAKSSKPVEPFIKLTEELKGIYFIFELHTNSQYLITVYKDQINKITAEKIQLSKTLDVEKKMSKMKTIQIESGDTYVFNILIIIIEYQFLVF